MKYDLLAGNEVIKTVNGKKEVDSYMTDTLRDSSLLDWRVGYHFKLRCTSTEFKWVKHGTTELLKV